MPEILGGPYYIVVGAGESHGPAVTTIALGCPPGMAIDRESIQEDLDRRRPGGNKHGTPRNEKDKVVLTSGLFQPDAEKLLGPTQVSTTVGEVTSQTLGYESGLSTGEPLSALVLSTSQKSGHYNQLLGEGGQVRPGHTDLVKFHQSKGHVDVRGGGRSSYRSTISDVVGGSIARQVLRQVFQTEILSSIVGVGKLRAKTTLASTFNRLRVDDASVEEVKEKLAKNEIATLDAGFSDQATDLIIETRKRGDSVGAILEIVALKVPALVGDPLYSSLKLRLMASLGGLNAVYACEVGDGVQVADRFGSENNDSIRRDGYQSNTHGGMIGGITTGMPLITRVTFKPTSTIHLDQKSVTKSLEEVDFKLEKGRHDPCVGVRAGVTLESRMAIELLNGVLAHQTRSIDPNKFIMWEADGAN
ncbi:MAG: chorismate synthase [Planctomycetota bacterium]